MYMRYVFYFFTLALVFTTGMLVGHVYIPDNNTSMSNAISMPPLDDSNPALQNASEEDAQQALTDLTQALSACPVVVNEEKDTLVNRISLFLTLADFKVKQAVYATEMAKNIENTRQTAQFTKAAADYQAAKANVEQRANELFPLPSEEEPQTVPSTSTATVTILPSTTTLPSITTIQQN